MSFEQPDASRLEKKVAEECAKYRAAQRYEYQKLISNPHRDATEGGYLFDTGLQRFMSTKAKLFDYFRPTPKTTAWGLGLLVIPYISLYCLFKTLRENKEREYRSGKVSYKDRDFKWV